jgi:hypothetical protein
VPSPKLNPRIIEAVAVTAELTGTKFSAAAKEAVVMHLSQYAEAAVLAALARCQLELRYPLTLAAVMDRLDDGHPGPETAWALVAKLHDDDTIVWTEEMAEAYEFVRRLDDRVAARMAFLEQYREKLAVARAERRPPRWMASLGWDPTKREGAITAAVAEGKLLPAAAHAALPPGEDPRALAEGKVVDRGQVADLVRQLGDRLAVDRREADARRAQRPQPPAMEHDPLFKLAQDGGSDGRGSAGAEGSAAADRDRHADRP